MAIGAVSVRPRVAARRLRTRVLAPAAPSLASRAVVRVDVVIPTYRVPLLHLRRMVDTLLRDVDWQQVDTTVCIVVDDPESHNVDAVCAFERGEAWWARVRVRVAAHNGGASAARNRGIDDWHCGLHRAAVAMEQRREAWDFLACVLWLTVLATAFS